MHSPQHTCSLTEQTESIFTPLFSYAYKHKFYDKSSRLIALQIQGGGVFTGIPSPNSPATPVYPERSEGRNAPISPKAPEQ